MNTAMLQTERIHPKLPRHLARSIFWSAVLTGLCLGGPLSFPFWYGLGLYYSPASIRELLTGYLSPDSTVDLWLPSVVSGGVVWGLALARLVEVRPVWRWGVAGGIGVFLAEIVATTSPFLSLHRGLWPQSPSHIRWMMDLVLGVGLGGGVAALTLGLAVRWGRSTLGLALGVVLAAALPALLVTLGLDAIGIRWGAGNANMAKIVGLAFPAATVSAGALIGWYLAQFGYQRQSPKESLPFTML